MNIIAAKISQRRKELGLTQKDLAEKLNISDKTLSRWETGKQIPDSLTIPEIAKVLDISINEIYGVDYEENKTTTSAEIIDDRRISSYKITSAFSAILFILGYGLYAQTNYSWQYLKIGAVILVLIAIFLFLVAELTFEEFYTSSINPYVYKETHKKWFGSIVPVTTLIAGIIIPVFKAPIITMVSGWDAMLPFVAYQGVVVSFYIKRHLHNAKCGNKDKKFIGIYILAAIAFLCSIAFVISVLSNPYRTDTISSYDWQKNIIWTKLKGWELIAGLSFLLMNMLHSKKILGIWENSIKKVIRYFTIAVASIAAVVFVIIGIVNHNLSSKVSYEINEMPLYELTNYDRSLLYWIQECNIRGEEINLLDIYRYDSETGNDIKCYLIYLPHGYQDTEFKAKYRLGTNGKVLKLDFKNTTQVMDDNYYLCYLEVINNMENFELHTYLDGEAVGYYDSGDASGVTLYRALKILNKI